MLCALDRIERIESGEENDSGTQRLFIASWFGPFHLGPVSVYLAVRLLNSLNGATATNISYRALSMSTITVTVRR